MEKMFNSMGRLCLGLLMVAFMLLTMASADAKSLYLIANINASPSPVHTYDIQAAPGHVVFQAVRSIPSQAGGAVGLAIDTEHKKLFTTYEGSNLIQLVDATNFDDLGTTTAPGASNLAGVVVDQGKRKVYAVDRNTNHLYVYSWNSATNTLTLDGGVFVALPGVTSIHGLALDEGLNRLYMGDNLSATVRYFSTDDWALQGSFTPAGTSQTAMSIAVDTRRNLIYMGNAYGPYGSLGQLVKYDMGSGATTLYTLPGASAGSVSGDNIVGVAVDEDTGHVYATTGNQGSGGTDTLLVFDQNLNLLKSDVGDLGDPTGIAVPRADISYNPLNFSKVASTASVSTGGTLSYQLCYDNLANEGSATNVSISDAIPQGTTFVSASGPYGVSGGTVTWTIGTVAGSAPAVCQTLVVRIDAPSGSQIFNTATITAELGESSIPTSRTVTTDVTGGTQQPVEVDGQGDGGGGSAGWVDLLLASCAMLIATWTKQRRRMSAARPASLVACLALMAPMLAQADAHDWYAGASAGHMSAGTSAGRMVRDLDALGYAAQVSLDKTDAGGKLLAGYRFNPFLAVEAAYVDLGKVTSVTTALVSDSAQLVNDVSRVHPISIKGASLSGLFSYPIGSVAVFARLGLIHWKARAEGRAEPSHTPYGHRSLSGTGLNAGLGLNYDVPGTPWSVRAEWERFQTRRNDPRLVSFTLVYRF